MEAGKVVGLIVVGAVALKLESMVEGATDKTEQNIL